MSELLQIDIAARDRYIERVEALLRVIEGWCQRNELRVEATSFPLSEEVAGDYDAPGLHILKDDELLAKVVPIASKVIAADGRVDIVGWLGSHNVLFFGEETLGPKSATVVTFRPGRVSTARILRNVEEDGWYWFESRVRRAIILDEALFLDLLTDVSNYAF